MNALALSRILFHRDWKAGELRLLLAALAVAVAAIATVGVFVDRLGQALTTQAQQLLGADLVTASDRPVPDDWITEAERRGLRTARTVGFPSMALTEPAGDALPRTQLVSLKAVSAGYPLRGALTLAGTDGRASDEVTTGPPRGRLWVDAALLQALQVAIGDTLTLGDGRFTIERVIEIEPDRGSGFVEPGAARDDPPRRPARDAADAAGEPGQLALPRCRRRRLRSPASKAGSSRGWAAASGWRRSRRAAGTADHARPGAAVPVAGVVADGADRRGGHRPGGAALLRSPPERLRRLQGHRQHAAPDRARAAAGDAVGRAGRLGRRRAARLGRALAAGRARADRWSRWRCRRRAGCRCCRRSSPAASW